MIRSTVRSAGLAILLSMNGCGMLSSVTGPKMPGLDIAEAALQGGAGAIALHVSENTLQSSPNNVHALEIKGDALSMMGDYDGAAAIFQALLAKDPASIRANIGLGRIKLSKEPAAAEALFLAVLKRDPNDQIALNNVGIARDLQGRHTEAQVAYRQALAVNPDLDSATVNMALSLAMSNQGPAAIQMMRAEAAKPGATDKVKHDYAVVLAMSGHRPEAEAVLRELLPPGQIQQALDNINGSGTRVTAQASNRVAALPSSRLDDTVPPDVVQVPEVASQPAQPVNRIARAAPLPLTAPLPVAAPAPARAAMNTQPPMVVRPQQSVDATSDTPVMAPVNPVAAAMTWQRPLSLPIKAADVPMQDAPVTVPAEETVVAMPPVQHVQRDLPLPVRQPPAGAATLPALPPAMAAPEPRQTPYRPAQLPTPPIPVKAPPIQAVVAPEPARLVLASRESNELPSRMAQRDGLAAVVQFAAAPSEESAHAYWRDLVHRFPKILGQLEPTVVRYEHGSSVFWRVRTEGFGTAEEAQELCARMRAEGQDCFVPRS